MAEVAKSVPYDPDKFGEGDLPALGKYHALIIKAEEPDTKNMCVVEFQILEGTVQGQRGKTIKDRYFPNSMDAAPRLKHLWYITKVATLHQINNSFNVPMQSLVGKQVLIEVVMGKPSQKTNANGVVTDYPARPQVGYRPEAIDCKAAGWADVPRNAAALRGELNFEDTPMGGSSEPAKDDGDPFDFK